MANIALFGPKKLDQYNDEISELTIHKTTGSLDKDGFIGYSYSYKHIEEDLRSTSPNDCYCYYKHIAQVGEHQHLISLIESGGGTGHFSYLFIVERQGDFLRNIHSIWGGGDRANGGIISCKLKGKKVYFKVYASPDMLFFACLEKTSSQDLMIDSLNSMLDGGAICYSGSILLKGEVFAEEYEYP